MASIVERPKKDDTTTYQVKWRQAGKWQTENFGDLPSAEQFKDLVEAHGGKWPHGWVRGRGFAEPEQTDGDMPFMKWAEQYISELTGIDDRTRAGYMRELRRHLSLIEHRDQYGQTHPATIGNITAGDIQRWVRTQEQGEPDPNNPEKWLRKKAHPKSIANRHGLLFSIVQAAVESTPPLRVANCCTKTSLPRVDNGTEEEMCFLERDEYQRIARELPDQDSRDLVDWLVGTGMRWGEVAALQVRDLNLNASTPTASVQRSWKRTISGQYFLGPPKSRKSRRRVALSAVQVEAARRLTTGRGPEDYVFRTPTDKAWRHPNFYRRRWAPAVAAAVAKGLPKRPRLHDLRHTHVAWLIGANVPLPAIQARLGHESITTTVDRYGHLVSSLDGEITAAVEAAMGVPAPQAALRSVG